jgi:hypothetical protein
MGAIGGYHVCLHSSTLGELTLRPLIPPSPPPLTHYSTSPGSCFFTSGFWVFPGPWKVVVVGIREYTGRVVLRIHAD